MPSLLLPVPLLGEVVDFLDICVDLQLLFQLLDVLFKLIEDGDAELLILAVILHSLLHLLHNSSHIDLCDVADLDLWLSVEKLGQVLQEEREEGVLEDGVLH